MPDLKFKPKTENLVRGLPGGAHLRYDSRLLAFGGTGAPQRSTSQPIPAQAGTMFGNFAVFNEWAEIDSMYEGQFIEQLDRGAFRKTVSEGVSQIRVQYDHGHDDYVGSSPLGPITVLRDDTYYEVPLLDTDYNRDRVLPMLQGRTMDGQTHGSVLGASFRFQVITDMWDWEPTVSDYNPKGLPERTIKEVRLIEFGAVVFPAYPSATAMASTGMRSLTDHVLELDRHAQSRSLGAATGTPGTPKDEGPREHPELITGRARAVATNTALQLRRTK